MSGVRHYPMVATRVGNFLYNLGILLTGNTSCKDFVAMYGLVNKAIEQMVIEGYDEESWEAIKQKAEVDEDLFINMNSYLDDVTHRLVRAASEVLGLSSNAILQAFGEYWILYTAEEGYGELLKASGHNLPDFLENLDTLHARVGLSFPKLQPPSFQCSHQSQEGMHLHYHSRREGLAPMVKGLIHGLGKRFQTDVTIEQVKAKGKTADHDEFVLEFKSE